MGISAQQLHQLGQRLLLRHHYLDHLLVVERVVRDVCGDVEAFDPAAGHHQHRYGSAVVLVEVVIRVVERFGDQLYQFVLVVLEALHLFGQFGVDGRRHVEAVDELARHVHEVDHALVLVVGAGVAHVGAVDAEVERLLAFGQILVDVLRVVADALDVGGFDAVEHFGHFECRGQRVDEFAHVGLDALAVNGGAACRAVVGALASAHHHCASGHCQCCCRYFSHVQIFLNVANNTVCSVANQAQI